MRRFAVSAIVSLVLVLIAYTLSSLSAPGLLAVLVMVVLELPVVLSYYVIGASATLPYLLVAWFAWGACLYLAMSVFAWIKARVSRGRKPV